MNQYTVTEGTNMERFIFRLFFVYLVLYILFISDFISFYGELFPLFQYINKPFIFLTGELMRLVNNLFLHRQSVENLDFQSDTYWGYISALSFFFIASIISFLWTKFDKRKHHPILLRWTYTVARYYLAYVLFDYGIVKIFGNQFSPNSQNALLYSLPDLTPHQLLWSFMGVSKSYQIFAGLIEIIPALLLLFRRTTLIGALIAFPVILNVLMLNIGYDTRLKLFLFHLLIISVFILAPDFKKLFNFFALKKTEALATYKPVIENRKLRLLFYILKFSLISGVLFLELKYQFKQSNETYNAPQKSIVGIHTIKDFYWGHDSLTDNNNSKVWKKIAVTPFARFSVQFMDDSITSYFFKSVTSESIELISDEDSSFKCFLHYAKISPNVWLYNGTLKKDSVRFISNKIDLNKSPLLNDFGKTKWVY